MKKQHKNFIKKHPYATAAAVGVPAGAAHGVWKGALNGYAVAKRFGMNRLATKNAMKTAMKTNAVISAITGGAASAAAIYGFKIRKKHPATGGFFAGGVDGAIGSKLHSYTEEKGMKTYREFITELGIGTRLAYLAKSSVSGAMHGGKSITAGVKSATSGKGFAKGVINHPSYGKMINRQVGQARSIGMKMPTGTKTAIVKNAKRSIGEAHGQQEGYINERRGFVNPENRTIGRRLKNAIKAPFYAYKLRGVPGNSIYRHFHNETTGTIKVKTKQ